MLSIRRPRHAKNCPSTPEQTFFLLCKRPDQPLESDSTDSASSFCRSLFEFFRFSGPVRSSCLSGKGSWVSQDNVNLAAKFLPSPIGQRNLPDCALSQCSIQTKPNTRRGASPERPVQTETTNRQRLHPNVTNRRVKEMFSSQPRVS